jgi:hypothetical protein
VLGDRVIVEAIRPESDGEVSLAARDYHADTLISLADDAKDRGRTGGLEKKGGRIGNAAVKRTRLLCWWRAIVIAAHPCFKREEHGEGR